MTFMERKKNCVAIDRSTLITFSERKIGCVNVLWMAAVVRPNSALSYFILIIRLYFFEYIAL